MRFTRLHLVILTIGFIVLATGAFTLVLNIQQNFEAPVETRTEIQRISGNYTYSPISRDSQIKDYSGGNSAAYTESGKIRVNLNCTSIEELDRLPGVGPATAKRILTYRMENGPFVSIDDVSKIKGIGKKTVFKFKDIAYIGDPEEIDKALMEQLVSATPARKKGTESSKIENVPCGDGRININTATADMLETLPGIGPKTAEKIVADRKTNGPFTDINEFTRIRGIGPKTLKRMKDLICAE